jgi:hypothetical protein
LAKSDDDLPSCSEPYHPLGNGATCFQIARDASKLGQ